MINYANRKSGVHKLGTAFDDEDVGEYDLSYLDLLLGNTPEQMTSMVFKDRLLGEQERLTRQSI